MFKFILIKDAIPLSGLMVTELGMNISGASLKQKRSVWFSFSHVVKFLNR